MKPIKEITIDSYCYPSDPEQYDEIKFRLFADGFVIMDDAEGSTVINIDELKEITDELFKHHQVAKEMSRFTTR